MSANTAPRAIHHLSCGTLCPRGARLVSGEGGLRERAWLVCHCLLIEGAEGLVLIDTGFGLDDARNPRQLGRAFTAIVRPRLLAGETAISQLRELGFDPNDVRHIITTHLDLDHAGGLPDFPDAEVHVLARELAAALSPGLRERMRYVSAHWAHGPRWVEHEPDGEQWLGFDSVKVLAGSDEGILLIPLPGHTSGHSGVAVRDGDGWLLHCGDAFFHNGEVATPPHCPPGLRAFATIDEVDRGARLGNLERLRELVVREGDGVQLICSHDAGMLERSRERRAQATQLAADA
jgi:glyoxylase-like metal-dependent hydrolase (beta-lactamase superfamily II)